MAQPTTGEEFDFSSATLHSTLPLGCSGPVSGEESGLLPGTPCDDDDLGRDAGSGTSETVPEWVSGWLTANAFNAEDAGGQTGEDGGMTGGGN